MAKIVKLKSSAKTGHFYTTTKNEKKAEKLKMRKYDPVVRQHVEYTEDKV